MIAGRVILLDALHCHWSGLQWPSGHEEHAWYDGCLSCVTTVQVALMSEVARARAAVDVHIGVAGVADAWLGFLYWLSSVATNIPGLRAANVKTLVAAVLTHHPALAATSWAQDLVKRL